MPRKQPHTVTFRPRDGGAAFYRLAQMMEEAGSVLQVIEPNYHAPETSAGFAVMHVPSEAYAALEACILSLGARPIAEAGSVRVAEFESAAAKCAFEDTFLALYERALRSVVLLQDACRPEDALLMWSGVQLESVSEEAGRIRLELVMRTPIAAPGRLWSGFLNKASAFPMEDLEQVKPGIELCDRLHVHVANEEAKDALIRRIHAAHHLHRRIERAEQRAAEIEESITRTMVDGFARCDETHALAAVAADLSEEISRLAVRYVALQQDQDIDAQRRWYDVPRCTAQLLEAVVSRAFFAGRIAQGEATHDKKHAKLVALLNQLIQDLEQGIINVEAISPSDYGRFESVFAHVSNEDAADAFHEGSVFIHPDAHHLVWLIDRVRGLVQACELASLKAALIKQIIDAAVALNAGPGVVMLTPAQRIVEPLKVALDALERTPALGKREDLAAW